MCSMIRKLLSHQLVRFAIVGGTGTIVSLVTLYLFTDKVGLNYLISNIVAFMLAVTNNYLWNTLWTFKSSKGISGYVKYIVMSLITFGITTLLLYILTSILGLWYMFSAVITTLCGFMFNYVISKYIIWRRR